MNIILINHYAGSRFHGMEYRPYYLAREWQKMGHRPTIIASSVSHVRAKVPNITGYVTKEIIDGISYVWIKTPQYSGNGIRRAVNIFSFASSLWLYGCRLASSFKPDVVIGSSTYPLDMVPARRIAACCSAKLVFEVHDLWPLSPIELGGMSPRHPFIMLMQWAENYAYSHADNVVSILPNADGHMVQHGMAPDKFVHIPNGIDVGEWDGDAAPMSEDHACIFAELRQKGDFVVGYAGAHGVANALSSFVETAKYLEGDNISFVLVGQGPEKIHLQGLAEQMGLRNIIFLPAVSKQAMPPLLGAMDVLYIGLQKKPIFRFGISPNKLMDYMMAAKPIIHAVEAANDLVNEAQCGLSVLPEDPTAIARAVKELMAMSEEQRMEMGLRGRKYVMENHDYRRLARLFLENI